jgi:hypothetical protein
MTAPSGPLYSRSRTQDRHLIANVSCYGAVPWELLSAKSVAALARLLHVVGRPRWAVVMGRIEFVLDLFN